MTLRPLRPDDRDIELAFVSGLSAETRHNRLLGGAISITREYIERLVSVDFSRNMALAATAMVDSETLLGVARYVRDKDGNAAEFAIVVADAWHGRGIGTRLLAKLIDAARRQAGLQAQPARRCDFDARGDGAALGLKKGSGPFFAKRVLTPFLRREELVF